MSKWLGADLTWYHWMLLGVCSSLNIFKKKRYNKHLNHTSCVMVSMITLNVVHRRFKYWSAQIKDLNQYFLHFQDRKTGKRTPLVDIWQQEQWNDVQFLHLRNYNNSSAFVTGGDKLRIENIKNKIPWKVRFSYKIHWYRWSQNWQV